MQPVKVYLDHKDYVGITRGLLGDKERRDDVETFGLLHDFVEQGKATVYFSWVHISEALKYDGTDSDVLGQYCKAIEALTRGNCLLGPLDLRNREFEVFLSEEFGTPTKFNRENLAYGKYSDVFFLESFDLDEDPIDMFKNSILRQAKNRKERKLLEKRLANPNECKKLLRQQLEQGTDFEALKRNFPASEQFYDIGNMVSLFSGDAKATRTSTKLFLDGVCSFKNLITHYGFREPVLKHALSFDVEAQNIISKVRHGQALYGRIGEFYPKDDWLFNMMLHSFIEKLQEPLSEFCIKFSLPVEQVVERLKLTKIDKLPSLAVVLTIIIEYLKKHKGNLENGRLPVQSDLRDLFHASHIPYLDIFLTDRFFSVIDRKGAKIYKTEVLRSLAQLKSALKKLI